MLVSRHRHGAPVGVVLNRPTPHSLAQAFPGTRALEGRTDPVFAGGPVSPGTVVVLRRSPTPLPGSLRVLDDVFMSVAPEVVAEALEQAPPPETLRVYAGYAAWAPGQLEAEIAGGAWHVLPADAAAIFTGDVGTLWEDLLRQAAGPRKGPI